MERQKQAVGFLGGLALDCCRLHFAIDCNWAGVRIGTGPSSFLAVGICVGALGRADSAATLGGMDLALSLSLVAGCPFPCLPGLDDTVGIGPSVAAGSGWRPWPESTCP